MMHMPAMSVILESPRLWAPLAPAIILVGLILLGSALYAVRCAIWGPYRDSELEARGSTALLSMRLRLFFAWLMRPIWALLLVTKIPATAITTLSVLLATASGVAAAAGRFPLAGWLFLLAGVCDYLDGRLARALGTASPRGAALDSVLDRYSDAALLIGVAWFYRTSWVMLAVLVALVGSIMVPYVRARGEGLGAQFKNIGLLQRPERVVILGLTIALSPVVEAFVEPETAHPIQRLAVVGIIIVGVVTHLTAVHRLLHLLSSLGEDVFERVRRLSKGAMFRIVMAAAVATAADFAVMAALVTAGWLSPPLATLVGCGIGAGINFGLHRLWAMQMRTDLVPHPGRYAFVSVTSALLNGGAVAVLLLLPDSDYRIGWWAARASVFLLWNLPLQRSYIFAKVQSNLTKPASTQDLPPRAA